MAKARKKSKDYFGLDYIVSLILAIIPVSAWILGVVVRVQEKKYVAAVIRLFLGFNIVWILDIIFMAMQGKILRLLDM